MTKPCIIGAPQSSYTWAVRIAAAEKGVDVGLIPAGPHSPEVNAIHPFGRIPVFRHGDLELAESKAIATYLDRAFDGPPLFPRDSVGAARAEQWVSLLNTATDPVLVRRYLFAYIFPSTPDKTPDRALIDAVVPEVGRHVAVLERALGERCYLAGADFTFADANLVPMIFYARKFPEAAAFINAAPHLSEWWRRVEARPSVLATTPPAQT